MKLSKIIQKAPAPKNDSCREAPEAKPAEILPEKSYRASVFRQPAVEKKLESSVPQGTAPVVPAVLEQKKDLPPQEVKTTEISRETEKQRARNTYRDLINFARETVALAGKWDIAEIKAKADALVKVVVGELIKENDELLVLTAKTTNDNYMYSHLANVCILALRLGLGFSYSREKIIFFGTAALLHEASAPHVDLTRGVIKQRDNAKLTKEIYDRIQNKELTGNMFSSEELLQMAKVIGVVDIFESLSHTRKLRERKLPHEVLKIFIQSSDEVFENSIIKKFIEELSIYPPGSYVRLNSDQIGQVIRVNKKFPTRPVVEVLFDRDGVFLEKPVHVNLVENAMMQISDAVDEDKLTKVDKKGLMEISLHKWWTE